MKISQAYTTWILNEVKGKYLEDSGEVGQRIELLINRGKYKEAKDIFEIVSKSSGFNIPDEVLKTFNSINSFNIKREERFENAEWPEAVYNSLVNLISNRSSDKMVVMIDEPLTYTQTIMITKKIFDEHNLFIWIISPSTK